MDHPIVAVFGASSSQPGDADYEAGVRCGQLLVEAGFDVATGGYGGLMEAVSRGAAGAGGRVVGVTAPTVFPGRAAANSYVAEEIPAATLTERIHRILDLSAAVIALDGSIGTFTELVMAWNAAFVTRFSDRKPKPVVAVGPEWNAIVADLAARLSTDRGVVTTVETVEEAVFEVRRALLGA